MSRDDFDFTNFDWSNPDDLTRLRAHFDPLQKELEEMLKKSYTVSATSKNILIEAALRMRNEVNEQK